MDAAPERMVVAVGLASVAVLHVSGPKLETYADEDGSSLEDEVGELTCGDGDLDQGIWVWEGTLTIPWMTGLEPEFEGYDWSGKFRQPTDEEWDVLRRGESPWPNRRGG